MGLGLLELILILSSLIPVVRDFFKKHLNNLYVLIGMILVISELLMIFFVYSKLKLLYETSNLQTANVILILCLLLSIWTVIVGLKFKFQQDNTTFFLMFTFLIIIVNVVFLFSFTAILKPIYQLSEQITTQIPVPAQTSSLASRPSPALLSNTANWKTYTNTKVGFSVNYPSRYPKPGLPSGAPGSSTLYADGSEDTIDIIFGEKSTDSFGLIIFPFNGLLDELVGIETKTPSVSPVWVGGLPTIKYKELKMDGIEARWYKTTYPNGSKAQADKVYFVSRGHGFILHTDFNHNENEIEQMLSTFKFIR